MNKKSASIKRAIVRLAGDSGDGMQLLGSEWVKSCGLNRNDLSTMPDFPAEIRAPQGTLAGVSGFQIQFASEEIFTAGDIADVLVALNPAALKANIKDLKPEGMVIVNQAAFNETGLNKAGYKSNPLEDGSLASFRLISIDMNSILRQALENTGLGNKDVQKCKNFFCLGLLYWLYGRSQEKEIKFIEEKFAKNPEIKEANILAFKSGFLYGENTETLPAQQIIQEAPLEKGLYRAVTGNKALAFGLLSASVKAKLPLLFASYPITPASDILHELAHAQAFGAQTIQLEDEMAAICAAIGAAYGGSLAATATSGPGFALKAEALGYAVMLELPLIVIDVQRAGPSTGMPTKTEQADLMQAIYGRSGEAPLPVLAAKSPQDCFTIAIDAARIAINFMTPVVILSDAYTSNSSAPWRIVNLDDIDDIKVSHEPLSMPYLPYQRNEAFSGRAWVKPGSPDLIHQLGGLEKDILAGKVSYDPQNHHAMSQLRAEKIEKVKDFVPSFDFFGEEKGELLLVGFGGTFGSIRQATIDLKDQGHQISHLHLRMLNPLSEQIGKMLKNFRHVVVIEQNQGQLRTLLRAKFLVDAQGFNPMTGKPIKVCNLKNHLQIYLPQKGHEAVL